MDARRIAIRNGTANDIAAIAVVHAATGRTAYAHLLPGPVLAAITPASLGPYWAERLATVPGPARLLVAVTPGADRVVGFAHVGPDGPGAGELYAIHVHPRARGIGVGSRLLAAATQTLHDFGYRDLLLWVLNGNGPAQEFYRQHAWWLAPGLRRNDDIDGIPVAEVAYQISL